jgi:type VI secretion system VasD/TssJ family lipoprotein
MSLRSLDRFQAVGINELIDGPAAALGADLISFRQATLLPSEAKRIEVDVSAETRYIAVAGAIQAFQNKQWKDFVEYRSGVIAGLTGGKEVRAEVGDAGVRILRVR